jgi:acyl CoA:acetate/3-ketoacid CoA transferase alpha subunit
MGKRGVLKGYPARTKAEQVIRRLIQKISTKGDEMVTNYDSGIHRFVSDAVTQDRAIDKLEAFYMAQESKASEIARIYGEIKSRYVEARRGKLKAKVEVPPLPAE